MLSKTLVLLCLAVAQLLVQKQGCVEAQLDADKATELSRWIRQHFRDTGMNWVSPKMLKARATPRIAGQQVVGQCRQCKTL